MPSNTIVLPARHTIMPSNTTPASPDLGQAPALDAAQTPALPDPASAQVLLDAHGFIQEASVSAAHILGYSADDLRGRSLRDLASDGWQEAAGVAAARLRFGATESFELALKGRSGRRSLIEMLVAPTVTPKGGVTVLAWTERRTGARKAPAQSDLDQHLRVVYGLLQRQETERQQIATQLHDDLLPMAVMAKYIVEDVVGLLATDDTKDVPGLLDDAVSCLRKLMSGIDDMSAHISPRILEDLGLLPALESLVRDRFLAAGDVEVQCRWLASEAQIPANLKLDIYRIVETALVNVVQHSRAKNASVFLALENGDLRLLVEDDGIGFDPRVIDPRAIAGRSSTDAPTASVGIASIRRRVEANGGRFVLETQAHRGGTSIGGIWPV
jgi:two-component system NarL family sensor kinase